MAKFVTIGYGDQEGYDRTDEAVRARAHAADDVLAAAGAVMGRAGSPVQVTNHDGAGTDTTDGPFGRTPLPVAGFAVIEAATLDEAIEIAAQSPCAVAQGVIEVWPLLEA